MKNPKKPSFPGDAITIATYAELDRYLVKFAARELDLVLLLGRHGTGKTEGVRHVLGLDVAEDNGGADPGLYVEGHAQPYGLYRQLWEHRDQPIALDDLDRLYTDADCIRLLKPLCNSRPVKRLSWCSNITLQSDDVPAQFDTRSSVILIANDWRCLNANVRALEDRAIILHFDPSNDEVHRRVAQWFRDPEVYGFIERHLSHVPAVSMRYYEKGRRLRRAGFSDWQKSLLQMMLPSRELAVAAGLLLDPAVRTDRERVKRFVQETGRSRASYYRVKKQLPNQAGRVRPNRLPNEIAVL